MTLPLVTAVAPRWEVDLAAALARSGQVHVTRRCADVAELLGVAAAGTARVAVVSSDLRGLERTVAEQLVQHGVLVLGVHPPGDDDAARMLRRWGLTAVLPADSPGGFIDEALAELLAGASPTRTTVPDGGPPGQGQESSPGRSTGPATDEPDGRAGDGQDGPARDGQDRAGEGYEDDDAGDADLPPAEDGGGLEERPRGEVVVVWGPPGSPGRTTVAVNLAAELADPLEPVLVVDADTYAASVGQVLGVLDEVPGVVAAARAADHAGLDARTLAELAPEVRPGLRVLTGLPRADRWPELRDAALADVLEACARTVRWTVVDVASCLEQDEELSFDTLAPRRNGATLTALEAADHLVVVGTGDPVGLQRLVRALSEVGGHSVAERTVVVTRVRPGPVGRDPGRRIQEALERFAGVTDVHLVPEDRDALDTALLHGCVVEEVRPRSSARMAVVELARRLEGRAHGDDGSTPDDGSTGADVAPAAGPPGRRSDRGGGRRRRLRRWVR